MSWHGMDSTAQHGMAQHGTAVYMQFQCPSKQQRIGQQRSQEAHQPLHVSQDQRWHLGAADLQLPSQALWLKPWPLQRMGQPPIGLALQQVGLGGAQAWRESLPDARLTLEAAVSRLSAVHMGNMSIVQIETCLTWET